MSDVLLVNRLIFGYSALTNYKKRTDGVKTAKQMRLNDYRCMQQRKASSYSFTVRLKFSLLDFIFNKLSKMLSQCYASISWHNLPTFLV